MGAGTAAKNYDGTNDFATRGADLTGSADNKTFTFSGWIKLNGGDGAFQHILQTDPVSRVRVTRQNDNEFIAILRNASGTNILSIKTASTYTSATGWMWIGISANLATPEVHVWTNTGGADTDDADTPITLTDDTIDWTLTDWGIGARPDNGASKLNGCLSEIWIDNSFIDFSVESNRRKFIDASGEPVELGADGSNPGASPLIYAPDGNPSTNAGTGEDFTITGALTDCADTPGVVATRRIFNIS